MESQPNVVYDSTGKITRYRTKAGADTVFPFKSDLKVITALSLGQGQTKTYTFQEDYSYLMVLSPFSSGMQYKIGSEYLTTDSIPNSGTSTLFNPQYAEFEGKINKGDIFSTSSVGGATRYVILLGN